MIDPRLSVIPQRLKEVESVIAVSSGKGGVGKSVLASAFALSLREKGYSVGLLDLDLTSPASHIILGIKDLFPEEEYGIIPPLAHGMRYMSFTFFSLDQPAPLRGNDISNSIIELLAITRWGKLDYLVIDMPPGISDTILDVVRLIRNISFLLVTTPSIVANEMVRKQVTLFKELDISIIGIVENMEMKQSTRPFLAELTKNEGVPILGKIEYDHSLEDSLGDVDKFKKTNFFLATNELADKIIRNLRARL